MIWGLTGLYILFALLCTRQFNKKMAVKMVVCVVMTLAFYVVMTPACWSGIWEFFWYLIESAKNFRWNNYVLFAGEMYNKNTTGMPKAYLLRMMFLTVPVGILALALGGLIKIVCTLIRKPAVFLGETGYAAAIILAGMIPLGYAAIMETPVYNGWRHFYFCYGSVIMMAAYGIVLLREGIGKWGKRIYADFLLVGYLLLLAGGILVNYPHEYAYYNFLSDRI